MKTFRSSVRLGCLLLLLLNAQASPAAVSSPLQDWGQTTYDPNTGLEWLDLNFTAGQSYNNVLGGWNGYTTTQGYRFATRAEVLQLFQDTGAVSFGNPSGPVSAANLQAANLTLSLLGATLPAQNKSWMLYDPATEPSLPTSAYAASATFGVGMVRAGFPPEGTFYVPGLFPSRDYNSPEIASALVRVVPEPSVALLCLAALGLPRILGKLLPRKSLK